MRFAVAVVAPPSNPTVGGGFREIAESVHHALLALGHDSVLTNRLDLDERRTIVFGGNHVLHYGLELPKNPIFYNLEQLGDDSPWMAMPEFVDLFRRYPHWDYSQANIERLAAMGLPRPTYVPIGYVPELTRIAPAPEDIDVLFYGMLSERRYAVLKDLQDRGVRVKWLSGALGAARDAWIARSKIVLNIHFWEAKIFEIARVSYLLANRRAVVSESGADPTLERGLESGVAFADYDDLVDRCVELLGDDRARRELAERGYQAFTARDQAAIVQRALSESLERVAHRTAARDDSCIDVRREGKDQLRNRHLIGDKFEQDRDQLLARIERNPEDARSVFFLAQTYFQLNDFVNARKWYVRRVEIGGAGEEVYYSMYRLAQSMHKLDAPWLEIEDAYLRAWHYRPTRAEPLVVIARWYRVEQRHRVGYLLAQRATEIPVPEEDLLIPGEIAQIYAWRATDERAVCGAPIGKHAEAFALRRGLLARPDLPEPDRQRIAANRDVSVPAMLEAAAPYPEAVVQSLAAGPGDAEVTVSLVAGPDREAFEQTLNSFLNCCLDVSRVGRFLVLDAGLSAPDRAKLKKRYPFLEFARRKSRGKPAAQLAQLRDQIHGRFWLHVGVGWRFFAPENFITRLTAVLDAEPQVFQVGINFEDAVKLTRTCATEQTVRRAPDAGRYLFTDVVATGPAMFDTARLDRAGGVDTLQTDPIAELERPADADTGPRTASLDEVLCISGPPPAAPVGERARSVLAQVEHDAGEGRSIFDLAQRYFDLGDFPNARKWYQRRVEMGGDDEEVYYAMYQVAESMWNLGEPWPEVEDAYLRAWQLRPTRAEPLHAIACRYRVGQRYGFAYLFAESAAKIPLPEGDRIFVSADVYAWRATDEQAVCASWVGRHAEAFTLCRGLLARPDLPEPDRQRIAANRDLLVPAMLEAALPYPETLVQSLAAGPGDAEVTVSLVAGPDRQTTEQTLDSFLNCCLDVSRVGRFLVLDSGLSAPDRAKLRKRYGFLEFARRRSGDKPAPQLAQLRAQIHGRFWLHLGQGWRFFAPENYITRLTAVLDAEPQVFQVGINFEDAVKLTGASAAEQAVRRAPEAGRYLLTGAMATGPAMFDTTRLDQARNVQSTDPDSPAQPGRPAACAGPRTASLDEVLCISGLYL